jgi:endo-1,4-beta-D-glucanase Y
MLVGAALIPGCAPYLERAEYLARSWDAYRAQYVHPDGYVVDVTREQAPVISEAQGYALLQAVWEGDEETFERVFRWTEEHLRRDDGLYSWIWSPQGGGTLVDANTATDADQEIAFALILAAHRFEEPAYLLRAREILEAVRAGTRLDLPDGWFPSAGNWANQDRVVNLSYFVPYAYPYFQVVDPAGEWDGVARAGYALLRRTLDRPDALLIPDFMTVAADGTPGPLPPWMDLSQDFSFDAMRIFWRVALDCQLHGGEFACSDPLEVGATARALLVSGDIVTAYAVDGTPLAAGESQSFYGSLLPGFGIHAPELADWVLEEKLDGWFLAHLLEQEDRYWDRNWVWFGLAAEAGIIRRETPAPGDLQVPGGP